MGVFVAISNFLEDLVTKEIILILIETTGSYVLIYSRHRSDVITIKACTTKTEMEKLESQLGYCYSVSLDLSYFCPIEMLLIDPIHNLFLGTAKHFARDLWIGRSFLLPSALSKIEARLKNTVVPSRLGRLPVSINTGNFLTA